MSRCCRRKRRPLTSLLVWCTIKPLELTIRGLAKLFNVRTNSSGPAFPPPRGWHNTAYGPLYWDGTHWIYPDGRIAF